MKDEKLNQNDFQKETLDFSEMGKVEGGEENGCGVILGICTGEDSGCGGGLGICSEDETEE